MFNPWPMLHPASPLGEAIYLILFLLYLSASIMSASWISNDVAARRLPQPFIWAMASFFTFPWVFVLYIVWTRSPWYREGE